MKKENIIELPNPNLRLQSARIREIDDQTHALIKNMVEASLDWEDSRPYEISAALAAIQVDQPVRLIIVRNDFDDKNDRSFTALINPEIVKYEGAKSADYEGCLSVPGIYGKVPRYEKIRLRALDVNGNEIRLRAEGFLARVLQHEVDHTKGLVFIDHIRDRKDAFFGLDEKGELQPLDYENDIKTNHLLWD